MKHSKSMPVDQKTSRKNSNMYGSHNFDSGISMLSADGVIKDRIDDEELRRYATACHAARIRVAHSNIYIYM